MFDKFRDNNGKFKENLVGDVQGLLSLYNASYLGIDGEEALEEAKSFSIKHLKLWLRNLKGNNAILASHVQQALDVPLHWRMPRIEARNFIDIYQTNQAKNLALLELAKLDYNLVQSVYQTELKELAKYVLLPPLLSVNLNFILFIIIFHFEKKESVLDVPIPFNRAED